MGKQQMMILAVVLAGGLWAAETPVPASQTAVTSDAEIKAVVDTIQSLSGMLDGLGAAANAVTEDGKEASAEGKAAGNGRPLKNSIAIITAGAAAGASIGAATKKGTQAIVIGAIAGAAAGLIYERMTTEKKSHPEQPADAAAAPAEVQKEAKKPEVNKQTVKPVPAT